MAYKIDPEVLAGIAKQVVGLPLEGGELISRAVELLSAAYPTSSIRYPADGWATSRAESSAR